MGFNEYLGNLDDMVRIYDKLLNESGIYDRDIII